MGESKQHQRLVELLIENISSRVGKDYMCFIESDAADCFALPQLTQEGYRPDVMFQYDGVLIIGEAKTSDDIDREHSIRQYESYIKKCALFDGRATFLLAVPWDYTPVANNIVRRIQNKYTGDYKVEIVRGIGL